MRQKLTSRPCRRYNASQIDSRWEKDMFARSGYFATTLAAGLLCIVVLSPTAAIAAEPLKKKMETAADRTGRGVRNGAEWTGTKVKQGYRATKKGVNKGANAVGRVARKGANKTRKVFGGDEKSENWQAGSSQDGEKPAAAP
jgi:hypothetical protein